MAPSALGPAAVRAAQQPEAPGGWCVPAGPKLKVVKMDVDRNPDTPNRFSVRGIPTLLVFKDGKLQEQIVGYVPRETIDRAVGKHF